ncbi:MarC family protein [Herminiimonas sp. CN]|uniref:MarC family protein n=1 Tax=Herminiimonas sp. CN TaxID=1349818 RepID=UPI0009DE3A89|nr:MarC family protein [Herminiimonas sp. CN]
MWITIQIHDLVLLLTGLVSLFSPPAVIGPFALLTYPFPALIQKKIAVRMGIFIAAVLTVFAWAGQFLLVVLGITVPALTMAGGIALLLSALPIMLGQGISPIELDKASKPGRDDWRALVAVPIVFPLSVGAGMVSLIIATAGRFNSIIDLVGISCVCVIFGALAGLTLYFAKPLGTLLGPGGLAILSRISGVTLTAIAVQLLAKGIKELLPGLG